MILEQSRRTFLLGSCAVAATIGSGWPVGASTTTSGMSSVGFAGPNLLQIVVYDTKIVFPEPQIVQSGDVLKWSPNHQSPKGGLATLNGVSGVVSSNMNPNAAQLFRDWASIREGSQLHGFGDRADNIDGPINWDVTVDGNSVAIMDVFRKSVPIKTGKADADTYIHEKRHLVTVKLEQEVPQGATLVVSHSSIGEMELVRSDAVVSEAVHVCHEGYPVNGPKKGYVGLWLGQDWRGAAGTTDMAISTDMEWQLVSLESDEAIASGTLELIKPADEPHREEENFNGCDIYSADFSDVIDEGEFRLEVAGVGASVSFPIAINPYSESLRLAGRWYYHQRSGCPIEAPYGEGRTRPRNGHPEDNLTVWQTDVKLSETSEGNGGPQAMSLVNQQEINLEPAAEGEPIPAGAPNPDAWGGWHDAGDWDRRIQHMDAIYHIATMVELFETSRTLDLNIPESGLPFADAAVKAKKDTDDMGDGSTVLPDLIHEALWGISLWRRTQTETGGIIGGVEYSRDGIDGSVSWNPIQRAYAFAPEPWAAYRFTISASKLGHVIKTVCGDETLGEALISEARQAWLWSEMQWPEIVSEAFSADSEGDEAAQESSVNPNLTRARIAAAASLYRASGETTARDIFDAHNPFAPRSPIGKLGTRPGAYSYSSFDYLHAAREGRDFNPDVVVAIYGWATGRLTRYKRMGADYGLHSTAVYPWGRGWLRFGPGSNWRASDIALQISVRRAPAEFTLKSVIEGMWFGLGCNPSNTSFVQGKARTRTGGRMNYEKLEALGQKELARQKKYKRRIFCCTSTAC
ncbi:MAG: cellulase N-terminal Ig-like domain-containing protein, partial [Alphaproteobacteria bacterium]